MGTFAHSLFCASILSFIAISASSNSFDDRRSSTLQCDGQILKSDKGVVTSPNYPENYPNGVDKECYIKGKRGSKISISFTVLDIEAAAEKDCSLDWVEIGPTAVGDKPLKICGGGSPLPSPFVSLKSSVWIKFHSDSSKTGRGFYFDYVAGSIPAARSCTDDEFQCENKKCILGKWRCNSMDECGDGSDEHFCHNSTLSPTHHRHTCLKEQFWCISARTMKGVCLDDFKKCNGLNDCYLGFDESCCHVTAGPFPPPPNQCGIKSLSQSSSSSLSSCDDDANMCFDPLTERCDGVIQCLNGNDEKGCSGVNMHKCPAGMIPCYSVKGCFREKDRCDGKGFCDDNSDELNCNQIKCNSNHSTFLCKNKRCISKFQLCDSVDDCGDDSDELNCPCGGKIDQQSGWISSPGFPQADYPNGKTCSWDISVNHGHVMQFKFASFHFEDGSYNDFVEIYTGRNQAKGGAATIYKRLGKFMGIEKPHGIYKTLSNTAVVKFVSDSHGTSPGFNLTFQMVGTCSAGHITCHDDSNSCYAPSEKCDGVVQCLNGNDEKGCRGHNDNNCSSDLIPCATTKGCFGDSELCNGIGHCQDNSDESNCSHLKCNADFGTFLCNNKRCINESWKCDNSNDCGDDSDESDCPPTTLDVVCPSDFTSCNDGTVTCYASSEHCDGVVHCLNGNDEKGCRGPNKHNCSSITIPCASVKGCYRENELCNGVSHCLDNSDENNCSHQKCNLDLGTFLCKDKRCLSKTRLCDNIPDCEDNADEADCPCGGKIEKQSGWIVTPGFPQADYPNGKSCSWYITVNHGHVIQLEFVSFELDQDVTSNDFVEIYTGEKQAHRLDITAFKKLGKFTGTSTPRGYLKTLSNTAVVKFVSDSHGTSLGFNLTFQMDGICPSDFTSCDDDANTCYAPSERCDGVIRCLNGNDEKGCRGYNRHNCSSVMIPCASVKGCFGENDLCNGVGHCLDNSDENNCSHLKCNSDLGTFLCNNKRCIYESWKCDNTNDCEDNSDEADCPPTLSIRVVTAAVIGSLICGLLLVIALGCTCKLYALRMADMGGDRFHRSRRGNRSGSSYRRLFNNASSPLSRIEAEIFRSREAPPSYNAAMGITDPYEEAHSVFLDQIRLMLSLRRRGNVPTPANPELMRPTSGSGTQRRRDRDRRHSEGGSRGRRGGSRSASGSRSQWMAPPVPSRPLVPPTWPQAVPGQALPMTDATSTPSPTPSTVQISVRGNSREGLGLSPGQFLLPLATTTLTATNGRSRRSRPNDANRGTNPATELIVNGGMTNPAYLESLEATPLALLNSNNSIRFVESQNESDTQSSNLSHAVIDNRDASGDDFIHLAAESSSSASSGIGISGGSDLLDSLSDASPKDNSTGIADAPASLSEVSTDVRMLDIDREYDIDDDVPLIDDTQNCDGPSFVEIANESRMETSRPSSCIIRLTPPALPPRPSHLRRSTIEEVEDENDARPDTPVLVHPDADNADRNSIDASSLTTVDSNNSLGSSDNGNHVPSSHLPPTSPVRARIPRPIDSDPVPLLFPRRIPSDDSSSSSSSTSFDDHDDDEMPLF